MTRLFKTLTFFLIVCSCNNQIGLVEKRDSGCDGVLDSKRVFLVNTSKTETYRYTVKRTLSTSDSIHEYSTELITLPPGDERELGCDILYTEKRSESIQQNMVYGSIDDLPDLKELESLKKLGYTITNRIAPKNDESKEFENSNINSQIKHTLKFEITGYVHIKTGKK